MTVFSIMFYTKILGDNMRGENVKPHSPCVVRIICIYSTVHFLLWTILPVTILFKNDIKTLVIKKP